MRTIRRLWLAGILLWAAPAAGQTELVRIGDMVVDDQALLFASSATYGRAINGLAFQTEALLTVGDHQYASWYHLGGGGSQDVVLGRRRIDGTGWEVIDTGADMVRTTSDAHNTISMGVAGDGSISLAYDHHGHTLRYLTSGPGAATDPGWNAGLFAPERSSLNLGGSPIQGVTYPRFVTDAATGAMFMTYRVGGSGGGDIMFTAYDPERGVWAGPHEVIDGRDGIAYTDPQGSSTTRNAYLNGVDIDPTGRIHLTWTWRESAGGTNHDILYAFSDDGGWTWRNDAGGIVGTAAAPMRIDTPGLLIDDGDPANGLLGRIDRRNTLMNQQTQAVDADGRVHLVMWHATDDRAGTLPGFSTEAAAYFHYVRDPATGGWARRSLPESFAVGSRPDMACDADGNLYVAYVSPGPGDAGGYYTDGGLVIAAASKVTGFRDWEIVSVDDRDFIGEPRLDPTRLARDGVVSILLQENSDTVSGRTGTPLHVLDYAGLGNKLVWAGDDTARWTTGSGTDWDNDGDGTGDNRFASGDRLIFNDAAAAFSVAIAGEVAPASLAFENSAARSYEFTGGGITGSGRLDLTGGGTVRLANGPTSFAGGIRIDSGTLQLAGSSTLAAGSITIGPAGLLDVTGRPGGLVLEAGQMLVHEAAAGLAGDLTIAAGGLARGGGSFQGDLTVRAGGRLLLGGDGITIASAGVPIDDFEGYSPGDVQQVASPPWTAHAATPLADIVVAGSGNQALAIGGPNSGFVGTSRSLPAEAVIADGETATLFFRFNARTSALDQTFGLGDQATTATVNFPDFESQVRLSGDGGSPTFQLDARDGGGFTPPLATGLTTDTWYNLWLVVDQAADTYDVYLNTGTGLAAEGDRLNAVPLRFRNGTADPLDRILGLVGSSPIEQPLVFDDLFAMPGRSLANPLRGLEPVVRDDAAVIGVAGDLVLEAASTLQIDLAHAGGPRADRLEVGGQATLAGTLSLAIPADASPRTGDVFPVVTAAGLAGRFERIEAIDLGDDRVLQPVYGPTSLVLRAVGVGDGNADRVVDQADLDLLQERWRREVPYAAVGDWVADRFIDEQDLAAVVARWSAAESVPIVTIPVAGGAVTPAEAGYGSLPDVVGLTKTGTGTLIVSREEGRHGPTTVAAGTLLVAAADALAASPTAVDAGATLAISPGLAARLPSLELAGRLDVADGSVEIAAGIPIEQVRAAIQAGGGWSAASGIVSSAIAVSAPGTRAVGYRVGDDGAMLIAYAAPGDADLDGRVDLFDLLAFSAAGRFGTTDEAVWAEGDVTFDGRFNVFDLLAIEGSGTYGRGPYRPVAAAAATPRPVPEPGLASVLAFVLAASGCFGRGRAGRQTSRKRSSLMSS